MKNKTVDHLAVEMLLDGNDAGLERLANNLKHQLDVVMGRKCPRCGGSNVAVGDETGVCDDCEEYYDLPISANYDNDGSMLDQDAY